MDDERRGDARKETRTIVRDDADDGDPSGQPAAHLEVRGGAPSTGDDGGVLGDGRRLEALPVSLRHGSFEGREGRGRRWRVAHDLDEVDTPLVAEMFPPGAALRRTALRPGQIPAPAHDPRGWPDRAPALRRAARGPRPRLPVRN